MSAKRKPKVIKAWMCCSAVTGNPIGDWLAERICAYKLRRNAVHMCPVNGEVRRVTITVEPKC